jgi:hypothetical protein
MSNVEPQRLGQTSEQDEQEVRPDEPVDVDSIAEEWIIDLAVEAKLGRRMRPLGHMDQADVFVTLAGYRTAELFDFARSLLAASKRPPQPLTYEQIDALVRQHISPWTGQNFRNFARAVEKACHLAQAESGAPAAREADERSPTAFALEFAEYMAKDAERLLEAAAAMFDAQEAYLSADGDEEERRDAMCLAESTYDEHVRGLRNGIYEFRKRAARAAPTGVPQDSEPTRSDE